MSLQAEMSTAGLVFISDLFDAGWKARVNDRETPILRANHAFRGIVLPAGTSRIELAYRPASFPLALACCAVGAVVLIAWLVWIGRSRRASMQPSDAP